MSDKKEPQIIDLSKEDRNAIAEYVYSYKQDILIVSDAVNVLVVLKKHDLIDVKLYDRLVRDLENKEQGVSQQILNIIGQKISSKQGGAILKEYHGANYHINL